MKSFEEELSTENFGIDPDKGKSDKTDGNCRNCKKISVFRSQAIEFEIYKKISKQIIKTRKNIFRNCKI